MLSARNIVIFCVTNIRISFLLDHCFLSLKADVPVNFSSLFHFSSISSARFRSYSKPLRPSRTKTCELNLNDSRDLFNFMRRINVELKCFENVGKNNRIHSVDETVRHRVRHGNGLSESEANLPGGKSRLVCGLQLSTGFSTRNRNTLHTSLEQRGNRNDSFAVRCRPMGRPKNFDI